MTPAFRIAAALLVAAWSAHATAQAIQPRPAEDIAALDLPGVVTALKQDCATMNSAFAELQRRQPAAAGDAPDCGGVGMAADFDPTIGDDDLLASMEALASNVERLVARGEALQAVGATLGSAPAVRPQPTAARAPASATMPRRAAAFAPANSAAAATPRTKRQIECEQWHYADVALCSDSACKMVTFRKWEQCLKTGRYF